MEQPCSAGCYDDICDNSRELLPSSATSENCNNQQVNNDGFTQATQENQKPENKFLCIVRRRDYKIRDCKHPFFPLLHYLKDLVRSGSSCQDVVVQKAKQITLRLLDGFDRVAK